MTTVCLIKADQYDQELILKGLRLAWSSLELSKLFKPGESILLKPNLLSAVSAEQAVTTDPAVFAAVARLFRELEMEQPLRLSYGDSPAHESTAKAARISGLAAVAEELAIEAADFEHSQEIEFPADSSIRKLHIANGVLNSDGLVSICKFKTHALTGITGALKNQFGVVPGLRKAKFHAVYSDIRAFATMLADLNKFLKPRLFIMDAIVSMEGNGPRNGRPKKTGYVLVGLDAPAVDTVMASVTGHDTAKMKLFQTLSVLRTGVVDPAKIEVRIIDPAQDAVVKQGLLSELIPELIITDFKQAKTENSLMTSASSFSGKLARRFIMRRPVIDAEICISCGQCVASCPLEPKALSQTGREVPRYSYDKCIRCFCCQEICPAAAIQVRRPWQRG
ncbi:MAG: DUF362 domain-containing protein [Clostridiaceae bacterium]|nr:DUF362 domain-containing protein [Clostridiaceae bacterium]